MTGTGTQNNPYIVDTWSDFVTAIGTSGVYVKVADDTIWDMNSIAPEGIGTIYCTCAELDGNNAIIKNAYVLGKYVFSYSNIVKNLQIENFLLRVDDTGASTIRGTAASTISNCVFSGIIEARTGFVVSRGNGSASVQRCALNISFKLNNSMTVSWDGVNSGDGNQFNHVVLDITNTAGITSSVYCNFQNSLIEVIRKPESTNNFGTSYAKDSIIRYNMNQETELNHVVDSSGIKHDVTSAQLQDAAYLASIGFPIGVD